MCMTNPPHRGLPVRHGCLEPHSGPSTSHPLAISRENYWLETVDGNTRGKTLAPWFDLIGSVDSYQLAVNGGSHDPTASATAR